MNKEANVKFRTWVDVQRNIVQAFQLEKDSIVTRNRVVKLVLNIGILDADNFDRSWNYSLNQLIEFYNKNGVCPKLTTESRLFYWLQEEKQRLYSPNSKKFSVNNTSKVSVATRKKKLEMFGFDLTKTISQCRNSNVAVEISSDDYDKEGINECHHNDSTEDDLVDVEGKSNSRKEIKEILLQVPESDEEVCVIFFFDFKECLKKLTRFIIIILPHSLVG